MVSLVFDPEKEQKAAEETQAEQEKALLAMQNTLAGHQLAIKEIDKKAADDRRKAAEEAAKAQADKDKEAADKKQQSLEAENKARLEALKQQAAEEERIRKEKEAAEAAHQAYVVSLIEAADRQRAENQIRKLKEILDAEKQAHQIRVDFANDAATALSAVGNIIGEQTAAGKAFALAQIATDTGIAISNALRNATSPSDATNQLTGGLAGIAKYAAIAAAILTNSARAIRIVKSGNPQQGGGSNQPGNLPGGGNIPAPSFASSTLGGGTQFAGSFDNRVYVTEGDITGTQRRVRQNRGVSVI